MTSSFPHRAGPRGGEAGIHPTQQKGLLPQATENHYLRRLQNGQPLRAALSPSHR